MRHYGDITKIKGSEIPLVDIVTGGSPCQDLSVAGKRAGLDGERSGLFMEQIRIIKEMRDESIRQLQMRGAAIDIRCIQPRFMVWENVPGAFSSNKGQDFKAVLEETAKIAEENAVIPGLEGGQSGHQAAASWEMGGLLLGEYTMHSFGECPSEERESLLSQILEATPHQKYCLSEKACQGILRRADRRGKELPPLLRDTLLRQSVSKNVPDVRGGARESSSNTNGQEHCQHLTTKVYCLQGNGIDRADTAGCNGKGWRENQSYTLNTIDRPAVLSVDEKMGQTYIGENVGNTLGARDYKQPQAVCTYQETTGALTPGAHAGSYNGQDAYNDMLIVGGYRTRTNHSK